MQHRFERRMLPVKGKAKIVVNSKCTCGKFITSKVIGRVDGKIVSFADAEKLINQREDAHGRNLKWQSPVTTGSGARSG